MRCFSEPHEWSKSWFSSRSHGSLSVKSTYFSRSRWWADSALRSSLSLSLRIDSIPKMVFTIKFRLWYRSFSASHGSFQVNKPAEIYAGCQGKAWLSSRCVVANRMRGPTYKQRAWTFKPLPPVLLHPGLQALLGEAMFSMEMWCQWAVGRFRSPVSGHKTFQLTMWILPIWIRDPSVHSRVCGSSL